MSGKLSDIDRVRGYLSLYFTRTPLAVDEAFARIVEDRQVAIKALTMIVEEARKRAGRQVRDTLVEAMAVQALLEIGEHVGDRPVGKLETSTNKL